MFTIGSRTVKTAIGGMIALSIAQMLGLENASTAAVITLLSVQSTQRKSILIAWKRLLACLLGMGLAILIFEGCAYTPVAVGLLLFIYVPLMAKLGLQDGIVPGFVIVMQLFMSYAITEALLINQLCIVLIGILVALLFNLYMPSVEGDIKKIMQELDGNFEIIFLQFSRFIRKKERVWNDEYIIRTKRLLEMGMDLARRSEENSFFKRESFYLPYFSKRLQQFQIVERMVPLIIHLPTTFEQNDMIADLVEEFGANLKEPEIMLEKLQSLRQRFESMDLPKTREEFETRAALLILLNKIEQFIELEQ
ncbi:aromatic acid exporter family protein [Gracilibacillus sp. Marseille-QA3620]